MTVPRIKSTLLVTVKWLLCWGSLIFKPGLCGKWITKSLAVSLENNHSWEEGWICNVCWSGKKTSKKHTVQVSVENGPRPDWNEDRAKPRRTSAPAELQPVKDALPRVKIKTRARTLSLRGKNSKQWSTSKTQVNESSLQKRINENPSTVQGSVKAIRIPVADWGLQRPLSAWTNSNNSV